MTTSTFTTDDLAAFRDAMKACVTIATSGATDFSLLQSVHAYRDGDHLVIEATDRYRLVRAQIPGKWTGPKKFDRNLTVDICKRILRDSTARAIRDRLGARLKFGDDEFSYTVSYETTTTAFGYRPGDYPKVGQILDEAREGEGTVKAISFDPRYLSDLCAMQPTRTPLTLHAHANDRPGYTTWTYGTDVKVEHALMPIRFGQED